MRLKVDVVGDSISLTDISSKSGLSRVLAGRKK